VPVHAGERGDLTGDGRGRSGVAHLRAPASHPRRGWLLLARRRPGRHLRRVVLIMASRWLSIGAEAHRALTTARHARCRLRRLVAGPTRVRPASPANRSRCAPSAAATAPRISARSTSPVVCGRTQPHLRTRSRRARTLVAHRTLLRRARLSRRPLPTRRPRPRRGRRRHRPPPHLARRDGGRRMA
jgi:hypothetical protein